MCPRQPPATPRLLPKTAKGHPTDPAQPSHQAKNTLLSVCQFMRKWAATRPVRGAP